MHSYTHQWSIFAEDTDSGSGSARSGDVGDNSESPDSKDGQHNDLDEYGPRIAKRPREQTRAACLKCKKRKGKCSGERPACAYCRERNLDCQYDVAVGSSRRAHLEQKLDEANSKTTEMSIILNALQNGTDHDSTMLLARLRMGEPLEEVVTSLSMPRETHQALPIASGLGDDNAASLVNLEDTHRSSNLRSDKSSVLQAGGSSQLPTAPSSKKTGSFLRPVFDAGQWAVRRTKSDADEEDVNHQTTISIRGSSGRPAQRLGVSTTTAFQGHRKGGRGLYPLKTSQMPFIMIDANLKNGFRNMPFSSSILANGYPEQIQAVQLNNLSVPVWAVRIAMSEWDGVHSYSDSDPVTNFLTEQRAAIASGISPDALFGVHPMMGAFTDEETFLRAPPLSQFGARMVGSIKSNENPSPSQMAPVYIFWLLTRWMIYPTPETYAALAEFHRPTPTQLFKPHPILWDYLIWPELRDFLINNADMFSFDSRWMLEMTKTIKVDWRGLDSDFLSTHPTTGELTLSAEAEATVLHRDGWYVGPTMRAYIQNADTYLRIK